MKLYTPFSARLSGSAKETELRPQSIFQWKKKRLPMGLILLVLMIALSCGGLAACRVNQTPEITDFYKNSYRMHVSFMGPNRQKSELGISISGMCLPLIGDNGQIEERIGDPFIFRTSADYECFNLALMEESLQDQFTFALEAPEPDEIIVRRWPREQQGTTGSLENGEILEYTEEKSRYSVSPMESGYIYSVLCAYGEYYMEYGFLATDDPEDQQFWRLEPAPEQKTYDFEGTVFSYGEKEYDLTDRVGSINSITDAVPVGKHIVVNCHVGPKNGVYSIFDTESESFVSDLIGNNLTWYSDDIETSVYSFWSDIYAYDGSLVKSYDLPEDAMIRDLAFSSDHTELTVTILYGDGTEGIDVIKSHPAAA